MTDRTSPLVQSLKVGWGLLLKLQRLIMLASILLTSSAIMIEVVMRYVFGSSIIGVQELAAYTALWLYFSGAAYGTYSRSHITAELTHLLIRKPAHLALVKFLTNGISFGLAAYILPWAWSYMVWGLTRHEQSAATLFGSTYPVVYFQISIFYGIFLMALYFLVEAVQWILPVLRGQEIPAELMHERAETGSWI